MPTKSSSSVAGKSIAWDCEAKLCSRAVGADVESPAVPATRPRVVRQSVLHLLGDGSQSGLGARDLGQEVLGAGGPYEGLGVSVVVGNAGA